MKNTLQMITIFLLLILLGLNVRKLMKTDESYNSLLALSKLIGKPTPR